ncbi:MAG TPA: sensor domain-containing diguanylate cyclase [bacterium]|nr:sensor domain-containing diguanylate cyclase [bacterium]HOM26307.1 sensor domain-containing diguanylate cyclase [bacterium]
MRVLRNFIFLFVILFLLVINWIYLQGKTFIPEFYLISFNIIISILIVLDIIFAFQILNKIEFLQRENERKDLIINDYKIESTFLSTITEIIETFGEDVTIDDVIGKILDTIKNIFKEEIIVITLFGDRYKMSVKGEHIEISQELIEELAIKGRPVLVNNISSFSQYGVLAENGIKSFIVCGLYQKKTVIGILGIFSKREKRFTLRDLNLLRMVSVPISLMIENTELFNKTKILSIMDSLTQLYNRRHFEKLFSEILTKSRVNYKPVSIAMCDVDYFKFYNDTNGHLAGDYVLKTIADILKKGVKGSDIVCRYGGEEFIIIFPDTTKENTVKICEKLRKTIREFKFLNEESQPNKDLTISFGIASFPEDGMTTTELIKKADTALYKAKELGRDRVVTA